MEKSNLELVQEGFEAIMRRDFDALLPLFHEDMEYRPMFGAVQGVTYHGPRGFREFFEEIEREWEIELDPADFSYRELDDDRVLVLGRMSVKGCASGVELSTPIGWVVTMRDGLASSLHAFPDEEKALASFEPRTA